MLLGYLVYFGLYMCQLAIIWRIDGIHKYKKIKLLTIKNKVFNHILIHYCKDYNIQNERKLFNKNKLYSNSIGLAPLCMQILTHMLFILFVLIRIQVYKTDNQLFRTIQAIVFSFSILYTLSLMVYQIVYGDRIMRQNNIRK
jgi:hypothetical protein